MNIFVLVCGIDGVGCDARAMPADQDREARDRHVRALFFSSLGLLSHESTRALVQGTAARDQAAHKQDRDRATRDRRVRALLLFCLCLLYHERTYTRALACRKPPLVTKPPTSEAEIEPQETVAYVPLSSLPWLCFLMRARALSRAGSRRS